MVGAANGDEAPQLYSAMKGSNVRNGAKLFYKLAVMNCHSAKS